MVYVSVRRVVVVSVNTALVSRLCCQMASLDLSNYACGTLIVFNSDQGFVVIFGPDSFSYLVTGVVHFAGSIHHSVKEITFVNLSIVPYESTMAIQVIIIKITLVCALVSSEHAVSILHALDKVAIKQNI